MISSEVKKTRNAEVALSDSDSLSLSEDNYFGLIEDAIEDEKWQLISLILHNHLREEMFRQKLDFFLPSNLLERISRDVVRRSLSEPYGLRGCTIKLRVKDKGSKTSTDLREVSCDSETVSTFMLSLTLYRDKKRWHSIKDLIAPSLPDCPEAVQVYTKSNYKLVKHKLYRSY